MASIKDRIMGYFEVKPKEVEILESDYTSILFNLTWKDGSTQRGIFYPKEWQLTKTEFDDLELEG